MAITVQGSGSASATTVTIPTHAVGDMIVIMARGTVAPTVPTAGGTVPTYTTIGTAGANNSVGWTVARAIATATTHTSGTWTNAAQMHVLVLRASTGSISVGDAPAAQGANNTQTIIYPALTLTAGQTANLAVRCGARGVADTEVETDGGFTTGGTFRTAQPASPNQTSAVFTKPITANEGSFTATPAGSNAAYRAVSFEIIEPPITVTASDGLATFSGPTISVVLAATASNGPATFGGGTATAGAAGGDVNLTASNGLATFSGPSVAVGVDLDEGSGVATFSGPTISVRLVATATGAIATFGGGTASAGEGGPSLDLTASNGLATFSGPSVSIGVTLAEGSGLATFGGGVVHAAAGTPPVTEPSLGGTFDEAATGGTFNGAASGGTPSELIRGGVVEDGLRVGTVVEQLRGGTVRPVTRSGTVVEPVRGGVFDETSTGGEVL
jgi:hypothetical protein